MRVVLLGYGKIGVKHAISMAEVPGVELVAIIENDLQVAAPVPVFSDLNSFLESGITCDLISICTPNGFHAEHAKLCLENDFHVLIEKPIALSAADSEEVIQLAKAKNKVISCVMQLRYSPVAVYVKELIEKNILGEIFSVEVRCYWNRGLAYYTGGEKTDHWHGKKEIDGGPLFTQFSHFIDFVYFLFGTWEIKHAHLKNVNHGSAIEFEDFGQLGFTLQNSISGSMVYTTASYEKNYESSITILGTEGLVTIKGQYFNEITELRGKNLPVFDEMTLEKYNQDKLYGHKAIYLQTKNAVENSDKEIIRGEEGRDVVAMIEQAYENEFV